MKHLLFDVDEPYEFPDLQEIRHISIPQAKVMSDHILYQAGDRASSGGRLRSVVSNGDNQIHCSATPHTELRHSHSHWVSLKRFTVRCASALVPLVTLMCGVARISLQ